jgi:hypothetical protein
VREYHYRVDRDGRIFHDGTEVVDPITLRFFLRAMQHTADDRYLVVCQGEQNWFHADDTPFVVQRLALTLDEGGLETVELCFAGDHRETLRPDGLCAADGHLVCSVRGGTCRARFGRVAMQQIAPFLVEDGRGPALRLGGALHPIAASAAAAPR